MHNYLKITLAVALFGLLIVTCRALPVRNYTDIASLGIVYPGDTNEEIVLEYLEYEGSPPPPTTLAEDEMRD